jgi:asparagine synthase (glutamine-hydrolysing)
MCGIAGWLTHKDRTPPRSALQAMTQSLAHRGPDGEGFFYARAKDGQHEVALGHRRLSIIDLAGGHQPMSDPSGQITLTYNGEAYNFQTLRQELKAAGHEFRTRSDTEVVIEAYRAWGPDFAGRLRGMFALALWDADNDRLVLARDGFGKKPLYIMERDDGVYFASEIKALLAVPGPSIEIDEQAVWDYLCYRYVPAPRTMFRGIRKLLPGTCAVWQRGHWNEQRYFVPPDREARADEPLANDPVGAFIERLAEAVQLRMVSDVPFGAYLSGGIDSSAVVALMTRFSDKPIKTFSTGYPEAAYSELEYASVIAEHFKTDHHEIILRPKDLPDLLPSLIRYRDAPVAEAADIPIYIMSKEAAKSVKMVLTGEGSDEILGGYPKHVYERYVGAYQSLVASSLHEKLVRPLVERLPYRYRRAQIAVVPFGIRDHPERMVSWFGAMTDADRHQLAGSRLRNEERFQGPQFDTVPGNSVLRRILYFDQMSWLPDNLLERGDRMTMAASIEARMPFMDTELARWVSTLPDHFRVRGQRTKWVLREAMQRLLPRSIIERPKVGFRVPFNEWFQTTMRDYLYDLLIGSSSITRDYYNESKLTQILNDHVRGYRNHEKLLWMLMSLELFHREYAAPDSATTQLAKRAG